MLTKIKDDVYIRISQGTYFIMAAAEIITDAVFLLSTDTASVIISAAPV